MPIGLIELLNILHAKIKLAAFPGIFSITIKDNLSAVLFLRHKPYLTLKLRKEGKCSVD